jgi:cytochrome c biogenesis protein CcmG, thiol:disulfide interchange protein DsbE
MTGRRRLALLVLGLVVALAGCADPAADAIDAPAADRPETTTEACPDQLDGAAAGELPPLVLDCLGGGQLDLQRPLAGPAVVNVWASWCAPCREEYPLVGRLADEAAAAGVDLQVLGVVTQDTAGAASSFAADAGVDLPAAMDPQGQLLRAEGLIGAPVTWFLRADGSVAHLEVGAVDSFDELRSLVDTHLGVRW